MGMWSSDEDSSDEEEEKEEKKEEKEEKETKKENVSLSCLIQSHTCSQQ